VTTYLLVALILGVTPWQPIRPGVWYRESPMATKGALAPVRALAVRIDPRQVRFSLDAVSRDAGVRTGWSIDRMGDAGMVAFNAGQFDAAGSWGWVVTDGVELQPPGSGSLAMAFVVDHSGTVSLIEPTAIPRSRGRVRLAFQSYPALLVGGGTLPWELEAPGRGVDLGHRDSRLALGLRDDGSVIVVLTRFSGLGPGGEVLPWGPTVREMATYMKLLGCRRAVLLDGGMSGQLALRDSGGAVRRWPNWRPVPLGVVVLPTH
jgi:exopolysaccharide biosynthesis protein